MKGAKIVFGVFFVLGLVFLFGSAYSVERTRQFLRTGYRPPALWSRMSFAMQRTARQGRSRAWYPRVRFQTPSGRDVEFLSNTGSKPPAYAVDQKVTVHNPRHPSTACIDSSGSIWSGTILLAVLGFVLMGPVLGYVAWTNATGRKDAWIERNGTRIQADIAGEEWNKSLTMDGRRPYQIVCQWADPARNEIRVFRSANLWYDPSHLLQGKKSLDVLIDPANPHRYLLFPAEARLTASETGGQAPTKTFSKSVRRI